MSTDMERPDTEALSNLFAEVNFDLWLSDWSPLKRLMLAGVNLAWYSITLVCNHCW